MLGTRWHKVRSDLSGNKTRTALVVLSISVGVFAVGVIANSQAILTGDLAARFASINPSSAVLSTAQPFDDELVQAVRGMKDVRQAEGRYVLTVRARKVGDESVRRTALTLTAIRNYDDIRINKIRSEGGAWPPPKNELLIDRASLDFMKANLGDEVQIETPQGVERILRVAGIVRDLNAVPPIYSAPAVGYISMDTLEWLGEPCQFNRLYITVAENGSDKEHIQRVAMQVKDRKLEAAGYTVSSIEIPVTPGEPPLSFVTNAMLMILGVLSIFVLLLSGFLVVNTISALLERQVRQIGVMKALGARTKQVTGMYLVFVLLLGLLALAIPLPFAMLAARTFSSYMADLLNFDLTTFSFPPQVIVLQIAIGLLVPFLAAFFPVTAGTRVTVREAISTYGLDRGQIGPSWIDRLAGRLRGLSRPLLLSLRNTLRRKGRLLLTLVPLTLGGALFIAVLSVRASLLLSLDELAQFWKYDLAVDLTRGYPSERLEREALNVPGVLRAESWDTDSAVRLRADGSESGFISVIAPPAATDLIEPIIVQGRWLLPDDKNAVVLTTTTLKQESDLEVGDELVLRIQGREARWRVVGVAKGGMTTIPIAYVNYPYLARVNGASSMANSLRIVTAQHDPVFQVQVEKALEEHFRDDRLHVAATEAMAELIERITGGMSVLIIFLLVLAILLALVGAIGLMGTMSLNVLERTREIGVMRAIGASDRAVLQIVIVEAVLVGILSWLGGIVLALPISRLLSDQVGIQFFQTPLAFSFSLDGILFWLVLVVALSASASVMPARQAARLSVREALAYE